MKAGTIGVADAAALTGSVPVPVARGGVRRRPLRDLAAVGAGSPAWGRGSGRSSGTAGSNLRRPGRRQRAARGR